LPRRLVVHPALSSWTSSSSTHRVWVWRALVADEDRVVRQILSHELSIAGWEVLLARDGEEARRLIDLHTPDVVVTDAELPLRTGLELLEDAEHMEAGLRPRFIVLSGQDPDEMAIRAFQLGAADFVSKPFHPGIVVRRLERLLGAPRHGAGRRGGSHRICFVLYSRAKGLIQFVRGAKSWGDMKRRALGT
jgi:DNA-binding response OmpR family regulator